MITNKKYIYKHQPSIKPLKYTLNFFFNLRCYKYCKFVCVCTLWLVFHSLIHSFTDLLVDVTVSVSHLLQQTSHWPCTVSHTRTFIFRDTGNTLVSELRKKQQKKKVLIFFWPWHFLCFSVRGQRPGSARPLWAVSLKDLWSCWWGHSASVSLSLSAASNPMNTRSPWWVSALCVWTEIYTLTL